MELISAAVWGAVGGLVAAVLLQPEAIFDLIQDAIDEVKHA